MRCKDRFSAILAGQRGSVGHQKRGAVENFSFPTAPHEWVCSGAYARREDAVRRGEVLFFAGLGAFFSGVAGAVDLWREE